MYAILTLTSDYGVKEYRNAFSSLYMISGFHAIQTITTGLRIMNYYLISYILIVRGIIYGHPKDHLDFGLDVIQLGLESLSYSKQT